MDEHPEPYIHYPVGKHTHTLILLHGTSQTGPEFAAALLNFELDYVSTASSEPSSSSAISEAPITKTRTTLPDLLPNTKFVFPTGSRKRTTVFNGALTHAWFDVHDFGDRTKGEEDQVVGMRESARYLDALVKSERKLLDAEGVKGREMVSLLGFSQGCAMGMVMLLSGLLDPRIEEGDEGSAGAGIGAFIGLSGWLPFRAQIEAILSSPSDANTSVRAYIRSLLQLPPSSQPQISTGSPIPTDSKPKHKLWLGHGALDTKVKLEWALQMTETLPRIECMDMQFESTVFEGLAHWFCGEEMLAVVRFLLRSRGSDSEQV